MEGTRMHARVGPPFILLAAAMLLTAALPGSLHAGLLAATSTSPNCGAVEGAAPLRAAGRPRSRGHSATVTPVLGNRGELTSRVLTINLANRSLRIPLPIESSVSEAFGDVILVTRAAGPGSDVRAINLVTGCETRVVNLPGIARGASVDRNGRFVYVHSVARVGRADAGLTRHDIVSGDAEVVVPALPPVEHVGPIFGTELRWSLDGSALAVQSCGFRQCVARILDVASGDVATFAQRGQGAFIGLTEDHLITYGACLGLPCEVLSTDLSTGVVTQLASEGFGASIAAGSNGAGKLTIVTAAGNLEFDQ